MAAKMTELLYNRMKFDISGFLTLLAPNLMSNFKILNGGHKINKIL